MEASLARVVIATSEPSFVQRVGDLLQDEKLASFKSIDTVDLAGADVLLLDAGAGWASMLMEKLPADRCAVLIVADPESLPSLPGLMEAGADAFVTLPTDAIVLRTAIGSAIAARTRTRETREQLVQARKQLMRFAEDFRQAYRREREKSDSLQRSLIVIEDSYAATVRSLALAVESKDSTTGKHIERVSIIAQRLAELVDPELAARPYLSFGFLLHDVGKIGVPDRVLTKDGPLTEEEFAAMREHPVIGARIVEGIEFLKPVHPIIRHHHERWDGRGYPDGLAERAIPKAARIFAVADAADAMLNDRPYRKALPPEQVREELRRHAGSQFDAEVVEAFDVLLGSDRIPIIRGLGEG